MGADDCMELCYRCCFWLDLVDFELLLGVKSLWDSNGGSSLMNLDPFFFVRDGEEDRKK